MARILGIDPGSRLMGYGLIDSDGRASRYVASGCLRVTGNSLPERLGQIFNGLGELIAGYRPEQLAIENVFIHRNVDSALKLGQARGAAICAAVHHALPVSEYAPREIKQAVVGRGGADKQQIQHMVCVLLNLIGAPQIDAADALAIALCHSHQQHALQRVGGVSGMRGGRLR